MKIEATKRRRKRMKFPLTLKEATGLRLKATVALHTGRAVGTAIVHLSTVWHVAVQGALLHVSVTYSGWQIHYSSDGVN